MAWRYEVVTHTDLKPQTDPLIICNNKTQKKHAAHYVVNITRAHLNELHTALPDRGAGSPSPQETEPRDSSAPLASGQLIDIQGLLLCMVNSEYLVARDLH